MFHSLWHLLTRTFRPGRPARRNSARQLSRPALEALEDRWMPNATTIAGFVYADTNNNGIMDNSENGVANVGISLLNSDGTLVATTTTDANGHYEFNTNPTVNVTPQTEEFDTTFANESTDWSSNNPQPLIKQFDPSLGTLTSVEILSNGSLTSDVKVENEATAPNPVDVNVTGQFTLSTDGTTLLTSTTGAINNQTTLAAGNGDTSFTGPASFDFGPKGATASGSVTLNAASSDLSAFIGTGTVDLTESASVSSSDTGNGNFDQSIRSTAGGTVQVIYTYIPTTNLQPGNYVVEKTTEPQGFMDGQTTDDNVTPLPNSFGSTKINVTLNGTTSSLQNNFAEVPPASLSGTVYHDLNDSGTLQAGDPGLGGVTVTLTGTNVLGQSVSTSTTTAVDGTYSFANLWAGTNYTLTESTLPAGFLGPNVSVGTQGGTAAASAVTQINLGTGINGASNNFGHILPSSLAGFVYVDANGNGVKVPSDTVLPNVAITLTGTDDQGNQVFQTTSTDTTGAYSFSNLRPGSYTISEAPPPGFVDGIDTPGSLGGTAGSDQLFVTLGENKKGINYNFAELNPPTPTPPVTPSGPGVPVPPPIDTIGKWFFLT